MSYYLFLDDERKPRDVTWLHLPENVEWTIVRNHKDFIAIIKDRGLPKFIAFDNDLCDEHYQEFFAASREGRGFNYLAQTKWTGYHCASWLLAYCLELKLDMPEFIVHSRNTFAQKDIKNLLDGYTKPE